MKLKFILPLYLALATATFCGRKITNEKDTVNNITKDNSTVATSDDKITGTLELDNATNTIYADLWLKVSSHDFKFAHDFMPLETDDEFKGIAFRYYDTVNNAPDNGMDTVQIHAVFNFPNDMRWEVGDQVRVMSLDEDAEKTFADLKPYFLSRMSYFGDQPCSYMDLSAFNEQWNVDNPENPVETGTEEIPEQEKKAPKKKLKAMVPRLTKNDGILSLKLKR